MSAVKGVEVGKELSEILKLQAENKRLRGVLEEIHLHENQASSALSFDDKQSCQDHLCDIARIVRQATRKEDI